MQNDVQTVSSESDFELRLYLEDFARDAYHFNIEEAKVNYWPQDYTPSKQEVERARAQYPNAANEDLIVGIQSLVADQYEWSWRDDFVTWAEKLLIGKICSDLKVLSNFFEAGANELEIEGEIPVRFENNEWGKSLVVFPEPDKLVVVLINAMRGDGSFWFDSVEEFFEVNNHADKQTVVKNHLPWLYQLESVYDSTHRLFRLDSERAWDSNPVQFGNFNYDLDELGDYLP